MADLQGRSIEIKPRSGVVELTIPSLRGRAYVEVREEGELDFDDEVVFRFDGYDDAQLVKEAFSALTEQAAEAQSAATVALPSVGAARAVLAKALSNTALADVEQAFEGECAAALTVTESGRSTEERRYDFAFADIDSRNLDVDPGRGAIALTLSVEKGEDYVRVTEDGEADGYTDDVTLRFTAATDVRAALEAVRYLADNCPDPVEAAPMSAADLVAAANVERFPGSEDEQSFERVDGKDCNYVVTLTERSGAKSEETEAGFSLRDLDPRQGELQVRGDDVTVVFGTRRGERVIDVLDGDGDQEYEDEVEIRVADVLTGRRFLLAMQAAIEACE